MKNFNKAITVIAISTVISSLAAVQVANAAAAVAKTQLDVPSQITSSLATSTNSATKLEPTTVPRFPTAEPKANIEGLELLEKIGRYEHDLMVYQAATPTSADLKARLDMASKFADLANMRFDAEVKKLGDARLALTGIDDASASFEVDQKTGNFLFEAGLAKYGDEASTRYLPKAEELQGLALKTLKQFDLPVSAGELTIDHVGGLNLSVADGKNEAQIFEKLKTIRFGRTLNGVPVAGDSRIVMHFGESAELAGLIYQIPKIEAARTLSPKLVQEPESMKKLALEELTAMAKKALRSTLTDVDLVIYDDGQGRMEPAYHIVLERLIDLGDKTPTMIPYDFYLPVSRQPVAFFPHMETALFVPEDGRSTDGGIVGKTD